MRDEDMAKLKPRDPQLQVNLGLLYARKSQPNLAVPRLQAALVLAPEDPGILVSAGEAYELLGDRSQAIQLVGKAIQKGYSLDDLKHDPDAQSILSDPKFPQGPVASGPKN